MSFPVVSKTRNGVTGNDVTRNRVTGFFFFFVSSFNLLLLTLFVCLPFLLFVFSSEEKTVKIIRIWRGFTASREGVLPQILDRSVPRRFLNPNPI